jgi:hypothetical protein
VPTLAVAWPRSRPIPQATFVSPSNRAMFEDLSWKEPTKNRPTKGDRDDSSIGSGRPAHRPRHDRMVDDLPGTGQRAGLQRAMPGNTRAMHTRMRRAREPDRVYESV